MVAAADTADLRIAADAIFGPEEIVEAGGRIGVQATEAVDAGQLVVRRRLAEQGPEPIGAVGGHGVAQAEEALAEKAVAFGAMHGDVASRFEVHRATGGLEFVQPRFDLGRLQRRRVDTHAAVDVVADGLGHDETAGRHHGADGDAGGLVEIGGDGDAGDLRRIVETVGRRLGEALDGLTQVEKGAEFVHGGGLDRHVVGGEKRGIDAGIVADAEADGVEAFEARVVGQGIAFVVEGGDTRTRQKCGRFSATCVRR